MKICPHCEFKLVEDSNTCPNCGKPLIEEVAQDQNKDNVSKTVEEKTLTNIVDDKDDEKNSKVDSNEFTEEKAEEEVKEEVKEVELNDDIQWSEFQDVSLGTMEEQLNEIHGVTDEELFDDVDPILVAYIQQHRGTPSAKDLETDEEQLEEAVETPLMEEENSSKKQPVEATKTAVVNEIEETTLNEKNEAKEEEPSTFVFDELNTELPNEKEAMDLVIPDETTTALESQEVIVDAPETITEKLPLDEVTPLVKEIQEAEDTPSSPSELVLDEVEPAIKDETPRMPSAEVTELDEAKPISDNKVEQNDFAKILAEKQAEQMVRVEEDVKKEKPNRKKYWLIGASVIFLGIGTAYLNHEYQINLAQKEQQLAEKTITQLENSITSFYLDGTEEFIQPDKTTEELEKLVEKLQKYKDHKKYTKINAQAQEIADKLAIIDQVNGYFNGPILLGDTLATDVHSNGKKVTMELLTEKTPFARLVNQALKLAKKEQAAIQKAKDALEKISSTKNLSEVTAEEFTAANKVVEKLPTGEVKKSLMTQLETLEKEWETKKNQTNANKGNQESTYQPEVIKPEDSGTVNQGTQNQVNGQTNSNNQTQSNQTTGSSTPTTSDREILSVHTPKKENNQPIISKRQSDIDDKNNPAWNWAPGVLEAFIKKCIDRGYIVEGGYKLERVRIEDGQGYYNLYLTNNKSKLGKTISKSSLPFYLVTVNDKTGFFRGNGSDGTGENK